MKCYHHYVHCSASVGQRSSAVKVQAKGIFPGSEVTTGKDSEDDLGSMTGSVIMDNRMNDNIPVGKVLVKWCDGSPDVEIDIEHRLGYDGKVRGAISLTFYTATTFSQQLDCHLLRAFSTL